MGLSRIRLAITSEGIGSSSRQVTCTSACHAVRFEQFDGVRDQPEGCMGDIEIRGALHERGLVLAFGRDLGVGGGDDHRRRFFAVAGEPIDLQVPNREHDVGTQPHQGIAEGTDEVVADRRVRPRLVI
jgi:hypothetical protein